MKRNMDEGQQKVQTDRNVQQHAVPHLYGGKWPAAENCSIHIVNL